MKAAQSARGCKVLSVTDTINGYDSITEEVLVTDEVDPGTEKQGKNLKKDSRKESRKERDRGTAGKQRAENRSRKNGNII